MNDYPDLIKTLIALSGPDDVIVIHRSFVQFTGNLESGMLLGQLLYWTPRARNIDGWIAKSDKEFGAELFISAYAIRQARTNLEDMGILKTEVHRFNGSPTIHYRLDLDELQRKWTLWIRKNDFANSQNPLCENTKSLTETTTQLTTETTSNRESPPANAEKQADPETLQWIADLEATVPPVPNPPHSAEEYKAQLLATEGRMLDRLRGEAWLLWGADCRELDAYDGQGQTMRRLGYELERGFGLKPAWSNQKAVKEWLRGMTDCLEASEGQVEPVLDAARKLLNDGLTVSGPYSLIKTTRALAAKCILKVSGTPKVLKVKP